MIPIVNEQDEIIGYKEREDRSPGDIVRITAVWVTDIEGNILLAQRSFTKKWNPGKWGPGVTGTFEKDETYESNAYKETEEELGLKNIELKPVKKIIYTNGGGKKFCQIYSLVLPKDTEFNIQKDEVEQVKWFTKEELKKELEEKPEDFTEPALMLEEFL